MRKPKRRTQYVFKQETTDEFSQVKITFTIIQNADDLKTSDEIAVMKLGQLVKSVIEWPIMKIYKL